jgi:hypothetical protein
MYFYGLDSNHVAVTRTIFDKAAHALPANKTRFHQFYFETESPWAHNNSIEAPK